MALLGRTLFVSLLGVEGPVSAAAFSSGVGVGLGIVATTFPTAVVVTESAELAPTALGLPQPDKRTSAPTADNRFISASLVPTMLPRTGGAVKVIGWGTRSNPSPG